jgi:hypothetical protein
MTWVFVTWELTDVTAVVLGGAVFGYAPFGGAALGGTLAGALLGALAGAFTGVPPAFLGAFYLVRGKKLEITPQRYSRNRNETVKEQTFGGILIIWFTLMTNERPGCSVKGTWAISAVYSLAWGLETI